MASALEYAHTHSTFQDAVVSPQGAAAVEHVHLAPSRGVRLGPYLPIFEPFPLAAAEPGVVFACGTT